MQQVRHSALPEGRYKKAYFLPEMKDFYYLVDPEHFFIIKEIDFIFCLKLNVRGYQSIPYFRLKQLKKQYPLYPQLKTRNVRNTPHITSQREPITGWCLEKRQRGRVFYVRIRFSESFLPQFVSPNTVYPLNFVAFAHLQAKSGKQALNSWKAYFNPLHLELDDLRSVNNRSDRGRPF